MSGESDLTAVIGISSLPGRSVAWKYHSAGLKLVPETTYRIWLLYMAGCAAAFRRGDIAVLQTLLSRPERGRSGLPLRREDWYQSGVAHEKELAA